MIIYSPTFTGSVQITGSQTVTGDLTVQGNLTAQTFILSSSVSYFTESFASGSTRFGDSMDDTMKVTGSLLLTGSLQVTGSSTFLSSVADYGLSITNVQDSSQGLLVRASDNDTTGAYILNLQSSVGATSQTWVSRLAVEKGGNVGIGTTAIYSGAKLHILGGLLAVEPTNGNTNSEILLGRGLSSLGTSAGSGITSKINFAFEGSNDNFYQELGFVTTTANQTRINSAADFYISTKAAGASSPTEKFRITSTGVVALNAADATYISFAYLGTNKGFIGVAGSTTDIISGASAGDMTIRAQQKMQFATGGDTPRMTIISTGNVLIGSTSDQGGWKAQVTGNMFIRGSNTTSANTAIYTDNSAGTLLFSVRNDGYMNIGLGASSPYNDTTATAANLVVNSDGSLLRSTASSQRFKENINDWNGGGLDTILSLKPKTFNYKESYYKYPQVEMLGLIAEEVAEVSPYLADFQNEDRTGQVENVRYATIVIPLIKAIQELKAEIDELKNK